MLQTITQTNTQPITQLLKQETRAAHDAIEQNEVMHKLMQKDLSVAHYQLVLQKKYGYYKAIEALIAPFLQEVGLDYELRKKTHLLNQDLNGLGRQGAEIQALPICANLPTITNTAQALGVLYVLEGSTLGGQLISRHLQQVLPEDIQTNTRFFAGYPKEKVGAMWQEFQQCLVNYAQNNPSQQMVILESANQTFTTLNQWMAI